MKKSILFVGSFLSKHRGTVSVAEKFSTLISSEYNTTLVSKRENKFLRLFEIVSTLIFNKYDYVHLNIYSGQSFKIAQITTLIAKIRKKKIILALQGGALNEFYAKHAKQIKKVFNRADLIYSPSYFLLFFFQEQGFKVRYLPNFVELKYFPYKRDLVTKNSLLWVRAFGENYNPELAIRTLKVLQKKFPDIVMTMVGPDRGKLDQIKQLIIDLDLNNVVTIFDKVPNEKLFTYFQTHSVYLNTTRYESFGLALIEAASCGIPIVSTNVGEIPYIWKDGEDIMLIKTPDEMLMAEKVKCILDSKLFSTRLSANARDKALKYDWKIVKDEWNKILKYIDEIN